MRLKAYAKINLSLVVGPQRPDGFHDIRTVFQQLELADDVQVTMADTITVDCDNPKVPTDETNLAWQAAALLRQHTGCTYGAAIKIEKNIPIAAGLAGGSADAAAVLYALNRIWALNIDKAALHSLAAQLGSDVPFCLEGPTALGTGRGEVLQSLPPAPPLEVVLIEQPFGIRAAEAYAEFDRFTVTDAPDPTEMVAAVTTGAKVEVARNLFNSLEPVVFAQYPQLGVVKEKLLANGANGALLSGSGPTVFALAVDRQMAEKMGETMCKAGYRSILTRFRC